MTMTPSIHPRGNARSDTPGPQPAAGIPVTSPTRSGRPGNRLHVGSGSGRSWQVR